MDVKTIDSQYDQLQKQAQETISELKELAGKLQTAAQNGNQDAREWLLDLKSIALAIQAEQNQVGLLLQALHGFVTNQLQQQVPPQQGSVPAAGPWGAPQSVSAPPPGYAGGYPQGYSQPMGGGGGVLGGFLNSTFGRALEMGAGFGIGDDLINALF